MHNCKLVLQHLTAAFGKNGNPDLCSRGGRGEGDARGDGTVAFASSMVISILAPVSLLESTKPVIDDNL